MIGVESISCYGTVVGMEIMTSSLWAVSYSTSDCYSTSFFTQVIGGVTWYVARCSASGIDPGDYDTIHFDISYAGPKSGPGCPSSDTLELFAWGTSGGGGDAVPATPTGASMPITIICRTTTTTSSTASTTSSTSTSTAGTASCTFSGARADEEECTGTPAGGALTATASIIRVINVSIAGTSATGLVTFDIIDFGGNAWAFGGPDPNLGSGGGYYFQLQVAGATDGTAQVCLTPSGGGTTMDYYQSPSGPWAQAAPLSFPGSSICGTMPVAALSNTTITAGVAGTATTLCTSTATGEDECVGTPVSGNLTAVSTDTGVNVSITGTLATGPVTINATDYGSTPPPSGADLSLGSGAAYYDVKVSGATDGTAKVCVAPSGGATTMDYYQPPAGPWTPAASLSFPDGSICGVIPVSALPGTPIAVGVTGAATTSSSATASTSATGGVPGVPEFPLALGIGIAVALALPILLLIRARRRNS